MPICSTGFLKFPGACGVQTAARDRGYNEDDVRRAFSEVGVSCDSCQG